MHLLSGTEQKQQHIFCCNTAASTTPRPKWKSMESKSKLPYLTQDTCTSINYVSVPKQDVYKFYIYYHANVLNLKWCWSHGILATAKTEPSRLKSHHCSVTIHWLGPISKNMQAANPQQDLHTNNWLNCYTKWTLQQQILAKYLSLANSTNMTQILKQQLYITGVICLNFKHNAEENERLVSQSFLLNFSLGEREGETEGTERKMSLKITTIASGNIAIKPQEREKWANTIYQSVDLKTKLSCNPSLKAKPPGNWNYRNRDLQNFRVSFYSIWLSSRNTLGLTSLTACYTPLRATVLPRLSPKGFRPIWDPHRWHSPTDLSCFPF